MNTVYLALGSNLQTPQKQIRLAIQALRKHPKIQLQQAAPCYKNKACGRKAQPNYYNTAVKIRTTLPPKALLAVCQCIETRQGRTRRVRWGARSLDIDIIFYGHRVLSHPALTIPHPRYQTRDFVLIPLMQLGLLPNSG